MVLPTESERNDIDIRIGGLRAGDFFHVHLRDLVRQQ